MNLSKRTKAVVSFFFLLFCLVSFVNISFLVLFLFSVNIKTLSMTLAVVLGAVWLASFLFGLIFKERELYSKGGLVLLGLLQIALATFLKEAQWVEYHELLMATLGMLFFWVSKETDIDNTAVSQPIILKWFLGVFLSCFGFGYAYLIWYFYTTGYSLEIIDNTLLAAGMMFILQALAGNFIKYNLKAGRDIVDFQFTEHSQVAIYSLLERVVSNFLVGFVIYLYLDTFKEFTLSGIGFTIGAGLLFLLFGVIRDFVKNLPFRVFSAFNTVTLFRINPLVNLVGFIFFPLLFFVLEQLNVEKVVPGFFSIKGVFFSVYLVVVLTVKFAFFDFLLDSLEGHKRSKPQPNWLILQIALISLVLFYFNFTFELFLYVLGGLILIEYAINFLLGKALNKGVEVMEYQKFEPAEGPTPTSSCLTSSDYSFISSEEIADFDPYTFENYIVRNVASEAEEEKKLKFIDIIEKTPLFQGIDELKIIIENTEEKGVVRKNAKRVLDRLSVAINYFDSNKDFYDLIEQSNDEYLLRILARYQQLRKDSLVLTKLFNDPIESVAKEALIVTGYIKDEKLLPSLIDKLNHPEWNSIAKKAIEKYGETAVNFLNSYFENNDADYLLKIDIIDILKGINSNAAYYTISKKAASFQRDLILTILEVLGKKDDFQIKEDLTPIYNRVFDGLLYSLVFYKYLRFSFSNKDVSPIITARFDYEIKRSLDAIFSVVKLIYGKGMYILLQKTLSKQGLSTVGKLCFDLNFSSNIKTKLLPVLAINQKFSPKELMLESQSDFIINSSNAVEELLIEVVNKDNFQSSPFTKALAIYELRKYEIGLNYLTPLLFSQHQLIWETAAYVLGSKDVDTLSIYLNRVEKKKLKSLALIQHEFVDKKNPFKFTLLSKIYQLQKIDSFKEVSDVILLKYADKVNVIAPDIDLETVVSSKSSAGSYFILVGASSQFGATVIESGQLFKLSLGKKEMVTIKFDNPDGYLLEIERKQFNQIIPYGAKSALLHSFDYQEKIKNELV